LISNLTMSSWYNFSQREHDIELSLQVSVQILQAESLILFSINALTAHQALSSKNSCKKIDFVSDGFVDFCVTSLLQYDLSQPGLYFVIVLLSTCEELTVNGKLIYIGLYKLCLENYSHSAAICFRKQIDNGLS